jgi:hypothetical protein
VLFLVLQSASTSINSSLQQLRNATASSNWQRFTNPKNNNQEDAVEHLQNPPKPKMQPKIHSLTLCDQSLQFLIYSHWTQQHPPSLLSCNYKPITLNAATTYPSHPMLQITF